MSCLFGHPSTLPPPPPTHTCQQKPVGRHNKKRVRKQAGPWNQLLTTLYRAGGQRTASALAPGGDEWFWLQLGGFPETAASQCTAHKQSTGTTRGSRVLTLKQSDTGWKCNLYLMQMNQFPHLILQVGRMRKGFYIPTEETEIWSFMLQNFTRDECCDLSAGSGRAWVPPLGT